MSCQSKRPYVRELQKMNQDTTNNLLTQDKIKEYFSYTMVTAVQLWGQT